MIHRDPKCVHVAGSAAEAVVTANFLEQEGIPARVMDSLTHGGLEGLNWLTGISARGIEVWVVQDTDVQRARQALEAHQESLRLNDTPADEAGWVGALCPECGAKNAFPSCERGSIGMCVECRAYVDVPEQGGELASSELNLDEATARRQQRQRERPARWGRRLVWGFYLGPLLALLGSGIVYALIGLLRSLM